jgi:lipopolysaccharide export system protein LptA
MGLLDAMLGNSSKIDAAKVQAEFSKILAPGEKVEHAYQLIRDYFVFTDRRFVLVDKQGVTGSKVEYHSIPTGASRTSASRQRAPSILMPN